MHLAILIVDNKYILEGLKEITKTMLRNPNVIPKIYKLSKRSNKAGPKSNKDTPKNGEARSIAGTIPIKVLIKAVAVSAATISLTLSGAINRFVKFLLQISSRNSILKLILDLNKKS